MSLQEILPYVTGAAAIVSLLLGILRIVSGLRKGAGVNVSIKSCHHGPDKLDHVKMRLTIRNRGTRSTSIESLDLKARSGGQSLAGALLTLQDQSELRRLETPYRVDTPLEPERYLPFHLGQDQTVFLWAVFAVNGVLTDSTVKCSARAAGPMSYQVNHYLLFEKG